MKLILINGMDEIGRKLKELRFVGYGRPTAPLAQLAFHLIFQRETSLRLNFLL